MGAHPWILERRKRLARGIYNRMQADGQYAGRQLISEAQFRLNATQSANGFSAYQMVFRSIPADNFGWGDEDADLLFERDTSLSGQFVARRKLRMMAREAALKEIANSKLRRILAFNDSFKSAGVRLGGEVLFYRAPSRKSAPRWRGPRRFCCWMNQAPPYPFKGKRPRWPVTVYVRKFARPLNRRPLVKMPLMIFVAPLPLGERRNRIRLPRRAP